ncbi:MAG: TonB-dependent receptor [Pseudomonadota bacterium]
MVHNTKSMRNLVMMSAVALAYQAAYAQQAAPAAATAAADSQAQAVPSVVVYAQRRLVGESSQSVPIALTALDPLALENTHSLNIVDIGGLAPGTRLAPLGTAPGFPALTIRGVGANASTRSIDPAVNIIQDGMVVAYSAGAIASTFDLESVEVLRGPQGVLFGRNSTGGAIALRTRLPRGDFHARTDVSFGNYNDVNLNASVEGPLGSDNAQGKVAVFYRNNSGTTENRNDGTFVPAPANPAGTGSNHATGYIGAVDELTIKPTFHFDLSDSNKLTLFTQFARYNDDGVAARGVPTPQGANPSLAQTQFGFYPSPAGYHTNLLDPGYVKLRAGHIIAELSSEIGAGVLTTTLAHRQISFDSTTNLAGGPFIGVRLEDNREKNHQSSFEARYNVPLMKGLDLTTGLFYLSTDTHVIENRLIKTTINPLVMQRGEFDQQTDSAAVYANIDWAIRPAVKVSIGGRYSTDRKVIDFAPIAICPQLACTQSFLNDSHRWSKFTPKLIGSWQPSEQVMLYASTSSGYRSGNYNPRITNPAGLGVGPANPETVLAYEVGAKTDWLDRKLRLNLSVYQNNYSDIQQVVSYPQTQGGPIQSLVNAAKGRIRGVEAEIIARPFKALTLEANSAYTDARYTAQTAPIVGVTDLLALRFPNVSKWTYYVAGTVSEPVPSLGGKVGLRVSYDWRSSYVADFLNTRGTTQGAYGVVNANLSFKKGDWSVELYGRNLGNVYYTDNISAATTYQDVGGSPRTYGVRLTKNF